MTASLCSQVEGYWRAIRRAGNSCNSVPRYLGCAAAFHFYHVVIAEHKYLQEVADHQRAGRLLAEAEIQHHFGAMRHRQRHQDPARDDGSRWCRPG